jgi:predicted MPP superfamily phosphohydrolase
MPTQTASPVRRRLKRFKHQLLHLPLLLAGGRTRVARHWIGQFRVHRHTLHFPDLPVELEGLTITHLSDLHAGSCFHVEDHLPPVLEACRTLDADLMCLTGDWVDEDAALIHPLIEQLKTIHPRLGWFGVIGNHDILDSREIVVAALRDWLGPHLLINTFVDVDVKGRTLRVAGLDYAHQKKVQQEDARILDQTLPASKADFFLGLSHHPHGFDTLRPRGAGLTLSGHTHGGQFSLTRAPLPAITPFALQFRYLRGLYEKAGAYLYVSVGLGHGFPVRIGNTPEIAHFTLRRSLPQ